MQLDSFIDILEEDIQKYGTVVLDILLKDRTTKNILWAVGDYEQLDNGYSANH